MLRQLAVVVSTMGQNVPGNHPANAVGLSPPPNRSEGRSSSVGQIAQRIRRNETPNCFQKAIRLLTSLLADMAGEDEFDRRSNGGGTPISRHQTISNRLFRAGKIKTVVMLLSEPDFVLNFRRDQSPGRAFVVELETYHDRVIRHTWAKVLLHLLNE